MQRILRLSLCLAILPVTAAGLVACGSSAGGSASGPSASSSTDVNTLLKNTFSGSKSVKSGKFSLALKLNISGGSSPVSGPVNITLGGPFESEGKGKLPKFDMDLNFSGAGQNIKAGAESTGDKAFVSFNGQDYVLSDQIFQQFKSGYEQAASQNKSSGKQSLSTLGINPTRWLTDPKNAGDGKVGSDDVVRITGGVDVGKLLDDVNTALSKAGSLGLSGAAANLPTQLTAAQKAQVEKALQNVKVEIDTGKSDSILRRILISFDAKNTGASGGSATVSFDLQLTDLNQAQSFTAPSSPKPFDQLLSQLSTLVPGLSGLASGASGAASGSSGSGSSSSSSAAAGASADKIKKYTDCINAAGTDVAKAQQCATLLTG